MEILEIEKYDSYNNGYNSTLGGDCKTISKVQDIVLLKRLFKEGKTHKEIAEVFNVDHVTIQRTLHSLGLRRNKLLNKDYLLANQHKTNLQIAKENGVHPETVSRAFKRYGIKRGRGWYNKYLPQNQKKYS